MDVRYIKRLIGLPGDKIQMIDGNLSVNGKMLQKDYVGEYVDANGSVFKKYKETLPNGLVHDIITLDRPANKNSEIFEVPQNAYFFMGDNRDNSLDSRFELGYVPSENIISKAKLIHFSTDHPLWVENQDLADRFKQVWVWMFSVRFSRMFHSIYN
jgi:signal peptidase I